MSTEKIAPCPMCGGDCNVSDMDGNIYCTGNTCFYCSRTEYHAEISAAVAYYRAHKDRRCDNCKHYIDHTCYDGNYKSHEHCCSDWAGKEATK